MHQHRHLLSRPVQPRSLREHLQLPQHVPGIGVLAATGGHELRDLLVQFLFGHLQLHQHSHGGLAHRGHLGRLDLALARCLLLLPLHGLRVVGLLARVGRLRCGGYLLQPLGAALQLGALVDARLVPAVAPLPVKETVLVRVAARRLLGLGLGGLLDRLARFRVRVTVLGFGGLRGALLDLLHLRVLLGVRAAVRDVLLVDLIVLAHLQLHLVQCAGDHRLHLLDSVFVLERQLHVVLDLHQHLNVEVGQPALHDQHLGLLHELVDAREFVLYQGPVAILARVADARDALLHRVPFPVLLRLHHADLVLRLTVGLVRLRELAVHGLGRGRHIA
mmetsp:Transcript_19493/g.43426  ORF Transcript_19493/g.43426 Transcript_19493/m.43426 type:complete len:333 (-) Transcript_19493:109-1107(-)